MPRRSPTSMPHLSRTRRWSPLCSDARTRIKQLGNTDAALADYSAALELDPELTAVHTGRGRIHQQEEDFTAAVADYTRAIELEPGRAMAYLDRANAYSSQGDYKSALADYNRALEIDPKLASGLPRAAAYLSRPG